MHTVELLEQSCEVAEQLGYQTRQEWLGGTGGGACEFAGRKWIFVDLALSVFEQLEQVTDALAAGPGHLPAGSVVTHAACAGDPQRRLTRSNALAIEPVGLDVLLDRPRRTIANALPAGHTVRISVLVSSMVGIVTWWLRNSSQRCGGTTSCSGS